MNDLPVHLDCNAAIPVDPLVVHLGRFTIGAEIDGAAG
jgi:hypothetical protein